MGGQTLGDAFRRRRPPRETALGEPFVAQPKPLAIVHEHLQRRPFAIAKDEHRAGERIVLPARTRDGHDIGVAHEVKARRVLVGPLDAHDEAASPRRRLVPLHLDARYREIGRKEVRAPYLVTGGWRAVVHALIADELLEEIGGLREDRRHDEGDSSRAPRRVRVGADSASSPRSA